MPAQSRLIDKTPTQTLLSNGALSVVVGVNGTGWTRWRDLAVTRWREDRTSDPWGSFLLLRDEESGAVWSPVVQPYGDIGAQSTVHFGPGLARFNRRDHDIDATLEITVARDADIELRRLRLHNHGDRPRTLSVTSYSELVIGPQGGDSGHPAFSKMFVETEWDAKHALLLATRRRRSNSAQDVWFAQGMQVGAGDDADDGADNEAGDNAVTCESDRARFLGRGHTLRDAAAMQPGAALDGTVGCVLDPVASLRRRVVLAPGASIVVTLWTQVGESRDDVLALAARSRSGDAAARVFAEAASDADSTHRSLGIDAKLAVRFAQWLSALVRVDPAQRATPVQLAKGQGGPPTLWGKSISCDRPIVLLRLDDRDTLATAADVLLAQRYWRECQLAVDVVILDGVGGRDAVADDLERMLAKQRRHLDDSGAKGLLPKAELFFLRDADIDDVTRNALLTVARVMVDGPHAGSTRPDAGDESGDSNDDKGTGGDQSGESRPEAIIATDVIGDVTATLDDETLEFDNGIGGFGDNGKTYVMTLANDGQTPAPWVNVIANPDFGCMISADGGGYAWSCNSQQNPLTPWPNDPVSDTPRDLIYLRDEDSGALWSATPLPIRVADVRYRVTHGHGYTRFAHDAYGIGVELDICVPVDGAVKLQRLRLCNRSQTTRRVSVTGYVEWALGANGSTTAPFVVTSRDASGALFARNAWRAEYGERVAFFDLRGQQQSISGDRGELLGVLGDVAQPAGLSRDATLSGRVGAGMDPCGALQTRVELPPGMQIDLVFSLGDAESVEAAHAQVENARGLDIDTVLADSAEQWREVFNAVQVRTPDRAMDIMLNGWLPYQALGCRLWARTAYYQSSGAFGFRDQLQDVMGMCVSRPDIARAQIIRASARQFVEGDVQHWWQPPAGQGVRTRITDDRIWLAYVAMHYIRVTGDAGVLDERTPFLAGQQIPDGKSEVFDTPTPTDETATVYEHAARGIDISMTRGAHGLPLIGSGDWNDGFNMVGDEGRGESAWLAWFLIATIGQFSSQADSRGEGERATRWRDYADGLRKAMRDAWDGDWYKRGYFDNGSPLGSKDSDECQIDTLAQSWSVMAGIEEGSGERERAQTAMASVDRLLIDREHRVARLFTPPFDKSPQNPGYIKGYPPGVRENGGQYTHGASWAVFAWAALGDGDRAGELFDLLNPIRHADSAALAERYKVEPYVVAADVYSTAPHEGRGGWTWYTGSGSWVYRAGLEAVLGFDLQGDRLHVSPCIPKKWDGFELTYRHRANEVVTEYAVNVSNPNHVCSGVATLELDGKTIDVAEGVPLMTDGGTHKVSIVLG